MGNPLRRLLIGSKKKADLQRLRDPRYTSFAGIVIRGTLEASVRFVLLSGYREKMANIPTRQAFEEMYAGKAPWDIGKPQPAFVAAASKVTGSVLDAGC